MGEANAKTVKTVLVAVSSVPQTYDYTLPQGVSCAEGSIVKVPFGHRDVIGVIWGVARGGVAKGRLKDIKHVYNVPALTLSLRRLVDWTAQYTLNNSGAILRLVLNVPAALKEQKFPFVYQVTSTPPHRLTAARNKVLQVLRDHAPMTEKKLREQSGTSSAVLKGLLREGCVQRTRLEAHQGKFSSPQSFPEALLQEDRLSKEQRRALKDLQEQLPVDAFRVCLLDGITGSGKTEVYFELVGRALQHKKQVLVMVPEIALLPQLIARFEKRFGTVCAVWHHGITPARRREIWRGVMEQKISLVVGARSSLFLPFASLGLIVVDEEHDASFKQEEGIIYNARDLAVVRAKMEAIPMLLSSASPSLETMVNVKRKRYGYSKLSERYGKALLPSIHLIDMRQKVDSNEGKWLSARLKEAMDTVLSRGEQVLIFLNRRGYAPLVICRGCGFRFSCSSCSSWLVYHQFSKSLLCHHCGETKSYLMDCPSCQREKSFTVCGPGVERVAEEVRHLFPDKRCVVMSSDSMVRMGGAWKFFESIAKVEVDIFIGTQILAKGHHFPRLTLIGVVDGDMGLESGDLRAGERSFQLLQQVSGRAGRAQRPGKVYIQTHMPDHPVMEFLVQNDRDSFLARELSIRAQARIPPFGRYVGIIISGEQLKKVKSTADKLKSALPHCQGIIVLGPVSAPLAMLRGRHRMRFLIKSVLQANVQSYVHSWLGKISLPRDIKITVDVDPYNFL